MTLEQFIEKHRHEVMGLIADAALAGRSGADLALWLRNTMKKVDSRLAAIYQELQPLPMNGTTKVRT